MRKIILIGTVLFCFILSGCSAKKEYFSPKKEDIVSNLSYDDKLSKKIAYTTINGITLADGTIISKDDVVESIKLGKDEKFLGRYQDKIIYSNLNGNLKIDTIDGRNILSRDFPTQAVSASIDGDDLAVVCADNSLYLIKLSSNLVILEEKLEDVYAIDSRVASPLFIDDIVIYPTLNGRLIIVHRQSSRPVQDAFVSTDPFFNNIIYLNAIGENLYAATNTTLILVTPRGNKRLIENIKFIFNYKDRIYVFGKDGSVKAFDLLLNEISQNKFNFAMFVGTGAKDDNIYMFEKTGYVIKTDLNLQNAQIYRLKGDMDEKSFVTKDAFYYDNAYIKLK